MPRVYESGKEFKGNNNSGRKTDAEIVRRAIDTGLANEIGNEELKKLKGQNKRSLDAMKAIVMPVVLKGIKDKKEITLKNFGKLIDELENE